MKLFDFIKEKIAKIPLISSSQARFTTFFRPGTRRNTAYYTGWVFLAVSSIAQEVAGINLKLFKEDSKGNVEQVFKHPALDLLKKVNDYMTQYDLFERLQSNMELQGNEYWFVTYQGNTPNTILPLPPTSVTPIAGKFEYVVGYKYTVDGEVFNVPRKHIIHFKQFNPLSDIIGLSTLEAARIAADTDYSAKIYNKKYFDNDARPDVILQFEETLTEDQQKRILEKWQQNHSGPSRQFKTAVASGGLKIESFQISQRDMEFLEGRKFNRDEIMAIFRVPLAVAGFTGNETYASAKAATYSFGARTVDPKMNRIDNTLNEFYLKLFPDTEGMYFEHVSPVLEDRDLVLKGYESGLKNSWLSINDVRRMEDLPLIKGGDAVRGPLNIVDIGEPVEGKSIAPVKPISKIASDLAKAIIKGLPEKKEEKIEEPKKKYHPDMDGKTEEEIKRFERTGTYRAKARDERGLEYERRFASVLKELWSGQVQRAINNLRIQLNSKNWKANGPNVIDQDREVATTIDLMTPLMTDITEAEGMSALEFLGIFGDEAIVLTPKIQEFIKGNTKKFAGEVTKVTSQKIRATIAAGIEKGEALADLEKRILESTAFSPARAEKIARSETIRAQTKAELNVWQESGVVEGKVWYTAVDERVCEYCEPMNGKTISLNDTYFKKGDTQTGNAGGMMNLDYENVEGPPLHPLCRCVLIPEIKS